MKKFSLLLSVFAVTSIFLTSITAQSSCPHNDKGKHKNQNYGKHRRWEDLNLTEEQKTELKNIRKEYYSQFTNTREELWNLHKKWKGEIVKETPDIAILNQYSKDIGKFHEDKSNKKVEHMLAVKKILKPEQFERMLNRPSHKKGRYGGGKKHHKDYDCNRHNTENEEL